MRLRRSRVTNGAREGMNNKVKIVSHPANAIALPEPTG